MRQHYLPFAPLQWGVFIYVTRIWCFLSPVFLERNRNCKWEGVSNGVKLQIDDFSLVCEISALPKASASKPKSSKQRWSFPFFYDTNQNPYHWIYSAFGLLNTISLLPWKDETHEFLWVFFHYDIYWICKFLFSICCKLAKSLTYLVVRNGIQSTRWMPSESRRMKLWRESSASLGNECEWVSRKCHE